jgi:hypothetical protein
VLPGDAAHKCTESTQLPLKATPPCIPPSDMASGRYHDSRRAGLADNRDVAQGAMAVTNMGHAR